MKLPRLSPYFRWIGSLSPRAITSAYLVSSCVWLVLAHLTFTRLFPVPPSERIIANAAVDILGVLFTACLVYLLCSRLDRRHLAHEESIREQASRDNLTGLYNRRAFDELLLQALGHADRHGERLALLFLDLDGFKGINDTHGHLAGDELLKEVARRLTDCCTRYGDDIVARMGGDEFILVQRAPRLPEGPRLVAERLLDAIARPVPVGREKLTTTASIGISVYPEDGREPLQLLRHADQALYRSKAQGRSHYAFYSEQFQQEDERQLLERGVRRALERDEFFLVYQPKLDTTVMRVVGVEALVRWQHPSLGELPAGSFVALAESAGLMWPLTQWVLNTACRQSARWYQQSGLDLNVAVNMSPTVFSHPNLEQVIEAALYQSGLPPDRLTLEITEESLMLYERQAVEVLDRLRRMGVNIQIDDFGTGYSSLASLRQYHFQALKIDRSFVNHVVTSSDDAAIATTIMVMSKCLDMEAIAEGVESQAQQEFLSSIECHLMQGYLFARPLRAEAVPGCIAKLQGSASAAARGGEGEGGTS